VTEIFRWLLFKFSESSRGVIGSLADAVSFDFSGPYMYDPGLRQDLLNAIPDWLEGLATGSKSYPESPPAKD
jgi:hypothetical protein